MTDSTLLDDDLAVLLRALAAAAAPTATAHPDLAATVLRRRRTRGFRRVGLTMGAGTLVAAAVAGAVLPGHGNYFTEIQPSGGMTPTVGIGDRVVFSKSLTPTYRDVVRARVTVADHDPSAPGHSFDLLMRVVGLPGDTVTCGAGTASRCTSVAVNGVVADEPYLAPGTTFTMRTFVVPAGEAVLLGDNRDASADSRVHGTIPLRDIEGVAVQVDPVGGGHRTIVGAPDHDGPSGSDSIDPPGPVPSSLGFSN